MFYMSYGNGFKISDYNKSSLQKNCDFGNN